MEFGILVVDMKKAEFSDTYYIGKNSSEVSIKYITATSDTLFAATDNEIYFANLADNLKDYAYWQTRSYPSGKINGFDTKIPKENSENFEFFRLKETNEYTVDNFIVSEKEC